MNMKRTTALVAVLGAFALAANAQNNTPPADGPPGVDSQQPGMRESGGPAGQHRFHLLPPRAAERLNLTDAQKKQIATLEAETKAKLEKILTPEQMERLKNMRPPMMSRGGPGMHRGPGGPGGDDPLPPNGSPPGDDNNPPPGGAPDDN